MQKLSYIDQEHVLKTFRQCGLVAVAEESL